MKKTILITAYAINPFKGSEDGTGWNISKEIAKEYNTVIVTRKNNRAEIERYLSENEDSVFENMTFKYHDLPEWAMRLKKKLGPRGYVLYFYFWQLMMPFFVRKNKIQFDLSYVLNFHSDSQPHFLWMLGKPVVWGPIGHHPKMPKEYLKDYGKGVQITDIKYAVVKWIMRNLDPFFYLAKWNTNKIIGINSSVAPVLRLKSNAIEIIPAVGNTIPKNVVKTDSKFNVLSVGRFTAMKGFDVTIRSFARFLESLPIKDRSKVKLTLVGSGECEDYLRDLILKNQLFTNVDLIPWVEREDMAAIYANADVFLFPSHEGAGMVVPEAMSYGLPVLCFDNVGPGELVKDSGVKIPYGNYDQSVKSFAEELKKLWDNSYLKYQMGEFSRATFLQHYTWEQKGKMIRSMIKSELKENATVAVFHPSAELYGADRILVNALNAIPKSVNKRVYLYRKGPLVEFIQSQVKNVEVIIRPDMPIIYRKMLNPLVLLGFIKNWVTFSFYLSKENKKHQFVSAYVNTLSASFLLPILWGMGIKRFIHVHEIIDSPKVVGKITASVSYVFAEKLVCVSNAVLLGLKRYVKQVEKKAIVIHNGINAIEVRAKQQSDQLNFYLFGRIKPEKGQWFLIEALSLLDKKILAKSKFILMGGATPGGEEMMDDLNNKIDRAGLRDFVEIRGFASNIADAMSQADVCLVPSKMKDPFPTTVLEAMSAAKPVITTNHGGAKEAVVDNETGFLVNPESVQELAHSIALSITQQSELTKIGNKGFKRYQNEFTLARFSKNWFHFNLDHQLI